MTYSLTDQTMALAGIFQATTLVDQLAKNGTVADEAYQATLDSLFHLNPQKVDEIYGGSRGLSVGLKAIEEMIGSNGKQLSNDPMRYVISLIFLEGKLSKRSDMLELIGHRLEQIQQQRVHFGNFHDNVIANLAGIYQDTLSTFRQRIQVSGKRQYLEPTINAERIRALLLSGVRSAMLWRQLGGRRWHLLFYRKKLAYAAAKLSQFHNS